MAKAKFTQDASKRLLNFYLDEADAYRLDTLCDERGISRTQFLAGLVATEVAEIALSPEDIAEINANIQKRIEQGYSRNFRSKKRYMRE
jgi:hypothetical protein